MSKIFLFARTIYNGYEPDNIAYIWGVQKGEELHFRKLLFDGAFKDGECPCSIAPQGTAYAWHNNHLSGVSATFAEAWAHLPALVTDPDHFEDTPLVAVSGFAPTELETLWRALRRAGVPLSPRTPTFDHDE